MYLQFVIEMAEEVQTGANCNLKNTNKIGNVVGERREEEKGNRHIGDANVNFKDLQNATDWHERDLKVSREVGDREGEGNAYCNLGNAYYSLEDCQKAIEYHERHLKNSKEAGERAREGSAYCNLGNAYFSLGDFQKAMEYHEQDLKLSYEVGDREGEGKAYGNLGNVYESLGDFQKAIEYHERDLKISKEVGDRTGEGEAYCNLGNAYESLGDFQKAIEYHERSLKISKEVRDRIGEGTAYCNLGNAYYSLGRYQKAIESPHRGLKISKEVADRAGEGRAYCNLGNAYDSVGDFQKAIEYHERDLKISKEVGDRAGEGEAFGNLGNAYDSVGDFQIAVEYHRRSLGISKEVGDRVGEGRAYCNLGNAFRNLGDFEKAIEFHERHLKISKEVGDRAGEGKAYGNLGNAYDSVGDFQKAIEYHERDLKISKEVGNRAGEGTACCNLGNAFRNVGELQRAVDYYKKSVLAFDHIRGNLISNDEWKISLVSTYDHVNLRLWGLQFKQGKVVEALLTAEHGRAQALRDRLEFMYGFKVLRLEIGTLSATTPEVLSYLPSNTAFIGINEEGIFFWVNEKGKGIKTRRTPIDISATTYFQSLLEIIHEEMALKRLYNVVIDPIRDLLHSDEVVIVPQGPLCLAPFAAFMDFKSKYLCETFRIRLFPSLSSLRLIQNCPADWHSKTGALLVGDPWVQEVIYEGMTLEQLKWAEKEVQMIGKILQTKPIFGKQATKDEVLRRISSVALVHIAAHSKMETGEIALAPNTTRSSLIPVKEDYLLTMKDVLKAQIRARLVVLSCSHSARGQVKSEGVVGIARAFLGAGARSVLVSLWAIDDEATMEFMEFFYRQLVNGRSASEALNEAMKSMRESDRFSAVKYWAPFVLIGDDVTLEFEGIK